MVRELDANKASVEQRVHSPGTSGKSSLIKNSSTSTRLSSPFLYSNATGKIKNMRQPRHTQYKNTEIIRMGGLGVWKPEMQDGQWAQQLRAVLLKNCL